MKRRGAVQVFKLANSISPESAKALKVNPRKGAASAVNEARIVGSDGMLKGEERVLKCQSQNTHLLRLLFGTPLMSLSRIEASSTAEFAASLSATVRFSSSFRVLRGARTGGLIYGVDLPIVMIKVQGVARSSIGTLSLTFSGVDARGAECRARAEALVHVCSRNVKFERKFQMWAHERGAAQFERILHSGQADLSWELEPRRCAAADSTVRSAGKMVKVCGAVALLRRDASRCPPEPARILRSERKGEDKENSSAVGAGQEGEDNNDDQDHDQDDNDDEDEAKEEEKEQKSEGKQAAEAEEAKVAFSEVKEEKDMLDFYFMLERTEAAKKRRLAAAADESDGGVTDSEDKWFAPLRTSSQTMLQCEDMVVEECMWPPRCTDCCDHRRGEARQPGEVSFEVAVAWRKEFLGAVQAIEAASSGEDATDDDDLYLPDTQGDDDGDDDDGKRNQGGEVLEGKPQNYGLSPAELSQLVHSSLATAPSSQLGMSCPESLSLESSMFILNMNPAPGKIAAEAPEIPSENVFLFSSQNI